MTTQTLESLRASKRLGSAIGANDPTVIISVKDSAGNAAALNLDADGNLLVTDPNGGGGGGGGDASAANQLTEIDALGDILTKLSADPATQTTLAAVLAKLSADPATQTTLAAILAKIIAAPATEAKQDAANTKLDTLHTDLTTGATPAGANEIGRTNIKHFNIAATGSGILTRPANTTAYAANDSVSDNATAGSVTALPVTVSDTNNDPVNIAEILLDSTDTGFGGVSVRVHVFDSDPTANSGVGGGDNAAWSNKKAGWVGSFSGTMRAFSDGSRGVLAPDDNVSIKLANVESGGKRLWWQLQTLGAATPSANGTVFTPRFKGYQGRA